jgi:predicted Zn-dependent peptidase
VTVIDRSRLPTPGPDPAFRFPVVSRRTLPNGLRVRTVEHRGVPVVSFLLLLSSGSAADPARLPGLAALTADMLDEGSGPLSALDIEDALSSMGAQLETEVGSDATVLSLLTLPRFADRALGLIADIVARPRLSAEDFDRVRDLRLNRLRQLRDLAPAVADLVFARVLYADHPYGRLPIGTTGGLEGASAADVAGFHRDVWRPSHVTIVAVGDVSHDGLFGAVERAFGWWTAPASGADSAVTAVLNGVSAPAPALPSTPLAVVDRPGAAQSELRIGQVAVPRETPDYYALLVLNTILGGQFVSRLNMNLREDKGYTYGVRSGFEFRRAPGPFSVQAAVQTAVTAEAVREVLNELGAIRGPRPATPAELEPAKSALTRGYARSFETAGQIGRGLAQLALYELPDDTLERFVPSIHAVDIAAVTAAAERLDLSRMTVTVVGDRERIEPGLAGLGLGAPAVLGIDGQAR